MAKTAGGRLRKNKNGRYINYRGWLHLARRSFPEFKQCSATDGVFKEKGISLEMPSFLLRG